MKKSDEYLMASKAIFYGYHDYACEAIASLTYEELGGPHLSYFSKYFKPGYCTDNSLNGWFGDASVPENQLARQLALLFMAEISKEQE